MDKIIDRKNTTSIKYIQLNDKNLFQPQSNIFWTQERLDKYIADNDLKNLAKMKTVQQKVYSDDDQTIEILMDAINDNMGQIFYIYMNEKFYWAYNISKTINAGISKFTLQLDLISTYIETINNGGLSGMWTLIRGHLIEKEYNIYHSDNCGDIKNFITKFYDTKLEIKFNWKYITFNNSTYRDIRLIPSGSGAAASARLTTVGNVITTGSQDDIDSERKFVNFLPLTYNRDNFDLTVKKEHPQSGLKANDTVQWINTFYLKNKFTDNTWNLTSTSVAQFLVGISNYPNSTWSNFDPFGTNTNLRKSKDFNDINTKNTQKWIILPDIFDFSRFEDPISKVKVDLILNMKEFSSKNHTNIHRELSLYIGDDFEVKLNYIDLNISNGEIYVVRIINYDNVTFKFYYDNDLYKFITTYTVDFIQGQSIEEWRNFMNSKSISYEAGQKLNTTTGLINLITNAISSSIVSKEFGLYNLITSTVGFGFDFLTSRINRYFNEQDIKNLPNQANNIPSYNSLTNFLYGNFINTKFYKFEMTTGENFYTYFYEIINNINIKKINLTLKLKIVEPLENDINIIERDQKLYGNVINELIEINNPLEIKNNDYNYIHGTFNYSNTGGYKDFTYSELIYLRDKFLQGLVVLNEANEWK